MVGFLCLFFRNITQDISRLEGWPDAKDGLNAIRKTKTIVSLSNINLRDQIDMVRACTHPYHKMILII